MRIQPPALSTTNEPTAALHAPCTVRLEMTIAPVAPAGTATANDSVSAAVARDGAVRERLPRRHRPWLTLRDPDRTHYHQRVPVSRVAGAPACDCKNCGASLARRRRASADAARRALATPDAGHLLDLVHPRRRARCVVRTSAPRAHPGEEGRVPARADRPERLASSRSRGARAPRSPVLAVALGHRVRPPIAPRFNSVDEDLPDRPGSVGLGLEPLVLEERVEPQRSSC